jgi:hypothetical protein
MRSWLAMWSWRIQESAASRLPRSWHLRVCPFCRGLGVHVDGIERQQHPEGPIGNPHPISSAAGEWTLIGYDELGFACLDEECPKCESRALIINEWDSAECLSCSWRESEPGL